MSIGLAFPERVPNVARLDHTGQPVMLYDVSCGNPAVLVFVKTDAELSGLAEALQAVVATRADAVPLVYVRGANPEQASALRERLGLDCAVLADADSAFSNHVIGKSHLDLDFVGLVTGPDLRIRQRSHDLEAFRKEGAEAMPEPFPMDAGLAPVTRTAPALIIPEVMTPAECRRLIEAFEEGEQTESGMNRLVDGKLVMEVDASAKLRRDHLVKDETLSQQIMDIVGRRILPELVQCFQFRSNTMEMFKIVRYDTGYGHFRVHRDNTTPDAAPRRFALTLNLNTHEYEGGGLRFPEFGPEIYAPPAGSAIVFSCSLAHEVLDVTKGQRYALLTFFSEVTASANMMRQASLQQMAKSMMDKRAKQETA